MANFQIPSDGEALKREAVGAARADGKECLKAAGRTKAPSPLRSAGALHEGEKDEG